MNDTTPNIATVIIDGPENNLLTPDVMAAIADGLTRADADASSSHPIRPLGGLRVRPFRPSRDQGPPRGGPGGDRGRRRHHHERLRRRTPEFFQSARDGLGARRGLDLVAIDGVAADRLGLPEGGAVLVRPDQYVAARWKFPDPAAIAAALTRAKGGDHA